MVPKEETQYQGIVQLLLHFEWTWIGLFAPDSANGDRFSRTLTSLLNQNDVCVAFSKQYSRMISYIRTFQSVPTTLWKQVNVFLCYADTDFAFGPIFSFHQIFNSNLNSTVGKLWITTVVWDVKLILAYSSFLFQYVQGSMSLDKSSGRTIFDSYEPHSLFLERFWKEAFSCSYSKLGLSVKGWRRCRENRNIDTLPPQELERVLSQDRYTIYNTIKIVVRGLQVALMSRSRRNPGSGENRLEPFRWQPWQVFSSTSLPPKNLSLQRVLLTCLSLLEFIGSPRLIIIKEPANYCSLKVTQLYAMRPFCQKPEENVGFSAQTSLIADMSPRDIANGCKCGKQLASS